MKRLLLSTIVGLALAGAAGAGPYEDAIRALDQGDLDASVKLLRLAGRQGNVTAQNLLGGMYRTGYLQIRRDPVESVRWYGMAARQFDREAQFQLGRSHESGTGAARDPVLAYMWYELAASGDHEQARTNRDRLAASLPEKQLAEARQKARDWKPENR